MWDDWKCTCLCVLHIYANYIIWLHPQSITTNEAPRTQYSVVQPHPAFTANFMTQFFSCASTPALLWPAGDLYKCMCGHIWLEILIELLLYLHKIMTVHKCIAYHTEQKC